MLQGALRTTVHRLTLGNGMGFGIKNFISLLFPVSPGVGS